jgi:hypothetical protein
LFGLCVVDIFLIAVFLIVGQTPLLDAKNNKFAWLDQHWHGLRNAAINSVIVFTLLYIPVVLSSNPQLSDSQFGVLLFEYSTPYHNLLRFIIIGFFILAVLLAIFLLILWLRPRPQVTSLAMTVRALAFQSDGTLLAGTTQGSYRSRDGAQTWEWIQQGPAIPLFTVPLDENLHVALHADPAAEPGPCCSCCRYPGVRCQHRAISLRRNRGWQGLSGARKW